MHIWLIYKCCRIIPEININNLRMLQNQNFRNIHYSIVYKFDSYMNRCKIYSIYVHATKYFQKYNPRESLIFQNFQSEVSLSFIGIVNSFENCHWTHVKFIVPFGEVLRCRISYNYSRNSQNCGTLVSLKSRPGFGADFTWDDPKVNGMCGWVTTQFGGPPVTSFLYYCQMVNTRGVMLGIVRVAKCPCSSLSCGEFSMDCPDFPM